MLVKRHHIHAYTDLAHGSLGKFVYSAVTANLVAEGAQGNVGQAFLGISIYHVQGVRVPEVGVIGTGDILRDVGQRRSNLLSFINRNN